VSSPWNRAGAGPSGLLLALLLLGGCRGSGTSGGGSGSKDSVDPAQHDAELLGAEVKDIVDRVMSFRSAHRGRLPPSLRQAGIDSITSSFARSLGHQGNDPLVTIRFRHPEGHRVVWCQGTNQVLEDGVLHDGAFEVGCGLAGGGNRTFLVGKPPPPKKK
jgi:hypothetical protein